MHTRVLLSLGDGLMQKLKFQYCWHLTWAKRRLTGKDSDAGKDWGQEEKRATEDKMIGWYHQLNGHEFELACCSPWGCRVRHNLETKQQWHSIDLSTALWNIQIDVQSWRLLAGRLLAKPEDLSSQVNLLFKKSVCSKTCFGQVSSLF